MAVSIRRRTSSCTRLCGWSALPAIRYTGTISTDPERRRIVGTEILPRRSPFLLAALAFVSLATRLPRTRRAPVCAAMNHLRNTYADSREDLVRPGCIGRTYFRASNSQVAQNLSDKRCRPRVLHRPLLYEKTTQKWNILLPLLNRCKTYAAQGSLLVAVLQNAPVAAQT